MSKSIRMKPMRPKGKREHQDTLFSLHEVARLAYLSPKLRAKFNFHREPKDVGGGWYAYGLLGLVDPDDIHVDAM